MAKYGARGETMFRLPKASRSRMKVVAAMGGYKSMLEWLEAMIAKDEKKYGIVQNGGSVKQGKKEVD